MTCLDAAKLLESWAAKAKTDESRDACAMAVVALRNGAKSREIVDRTAADLVVHFTRDEQGDQFIVSAGHRVVGARSLSDALDGLLEKIGKKELV